MPSKDTNHLGNNLRLFRLRRGLSQAEVAEQIPVAVTYYSDIERGRKQPALSILLSITKVLGVSLDELFLEDLPMDTNRYAHMIVNLLTHCDTRNARILYTVLLSVYDALQQDPDPL